METAEKIKKKREKSRKRKKDIKKWGKNRKIE